MSGLPLLKPWQSEPPVTSRLNLLGDFQIALRHRGRVFRVKTFDAVQPGVHERGDDVVGAVQTGMRHHREAAGLMNQFDAFQRGHLGFGHPGRAALFEKTLEGLVERSAKPGLHQRARDVRAPGRFAVGQRENGFHLQRHVQFVQARHHFADAVLPDGLEPGDFHQQLFVLRVHEITEEVKFGVVVLGGEFRAGDEFNARRAASRRHARAALDRVVVGQRQRREAEPLAVPDQFLRRKRAVGKMRVQMEIGEFHFTILAGRINSPFTLSRMPLTNLPLSCVENFLAMSTASLMLTTGGMSSRNSIS